MRFSLLKHHESQKGFLFNFPDLIAIFLATALDAQFLTNPARNPSKQWRRQSDTKRKVKF